jgi:hypothetical protein
VAKKATGAVEKCVRMPPLKVGTVVTGEEDYSFFFNAQFL